MEVTPTRLPRRAWLGVAIGAAVWAMAVAGLGGLFTELGPWYRALKQPPWKPPDLWFGPAWTLIFTLSAIALARAWRKASSLSDRQSIAAVAIGNGVLNVTWSWLFFKAKRPDWALAEVALLWLSIVVMMAVCRRHDAAAVSLLMPYVLWVAFAAALNAAVVQLNGPF
jgi:translocator protein